MIENMGIGMFSVFIFKLIGKPVFSASGHPWGWEAANFAELEHEQMRNELEYLRSLPLEVHP